MNNVLENAKPVRIQPSKSTFDYPHFQEWGFEALLAAAASSGLLLALLKIFGVC